MSEIPSPNREYFQGEDIPAEWIASDKEEIKAIGNDSLRTEVQLLARLHDKAITHERLIKSYERVEEMVRSGQVKIEDAAIWMDKIAIKDQSLEEPEGQKEGKSEIKQDAQQRSDIKTAETLADVLGVPKTEEQIARYRGAEANMIPFQFSVGSEPKFFQHLKENEAELWRSRALLTTIAANKKNAAGYEDLGMNNEAKGFTKNDLTMLLFSRNSYEIPKDGQNGNREITPDESAPLRALAMYVRMIRNNENIRDLLLHGAKIKIGGTPCPETFAKVTDGANFRGMKMAMRIWLMGKLGMDKDKAEDAENIAWNLVYSSNIIEEVDTRFNPKMKNEKRIPPAVPQFKSMNMWMLMHPQERFEAKLGAGKPGPVDINSAEAWGALGGWALRKVRAKNWDPRTLQFFPQTMFKNQFQDEKMQVDMGGTKMTFEEFLLNCSDKLTRDPEADLDIENIDWNNFNNTPFGSYQSDAIGSATKIFGIYDKGSWDKTIFALGDVCRKLKMESKYIENLLMVINGIDTSKDELKVLNLNWLAWKIYISDLKRDPRVF